MIKRTGKRMKPAALLSVAVAFLAVAFWTLHPVIHQHGGESECLTTCESGHPEKSSESPLPQSPVPPTEEGGDCPLCTTSHNLAALPELPADSVLIPWPQSAEVIITEEVQTAWDTMVPTNPLRGPPSLTA